MRGLRSKGVAFAVLCLTVVPMTSAGCFGRFALTRKIYSFNRDLSQDRWVRWFGFLVMTVFPVYLAGGVVDLVFANSIEFWGGSNPFASAEPRTRHALGPNGEVISVAIVEPGTLEVRVLEPDGSAHTLRVMRERDSLAAYDERGRLVARIGDVNGVPAILTGNLSSAPAREPEPISADGSAPDPD